MSGRTRPPSFSQARFVAFVAESNAIEGIHRRPTEGELDAHDRLFALDALTVADIERFVRDVAARPLRRAVGQDVRVGPHRPPPGGPHIEADLRDLLDEITAGALSPFDAHVRYETLHPFIDGNGRSGRAIWAWQMLQDVRDPFAIRFLQWHYYSSLESCRVHDVAVYLDALAEIAQARTLEQVRAICANGPLAAAPGGAKEDECFRLREQVVALTDELVRLRADWTQAFGDAPSGAR